MQHVSMLALRRVQIVELRRIGRRLQLFLTAPTILTLLIAAVTSKLLRLTFLFSEVLLRSLPDSSQRRRVRWEHRDVILGDSHGTDNILSDALEALILVF